jgi:predicted transposase YdaD
MLEETLREWEKRAWKKGRKEGRHEGRQEGLLQGARLTVLRLIEQRFGPVPGQARERIEAISALDELERMTDKILIAASLSEMGLG